ncbi:hypothetical protein GOV11_04210 [Candidatus Woesearchaeota archaeon]|nr:hypothetical protein [Candidatus Woesearchaeota archaeon]
MDIMAANFVNVMFLIGLSYLLIILLCTAIVKLWIELKAMQASTHQITYLNPMDKSKDEFQKLTKKQEKDLTSRLFDNIN